VGPITTHSPTALYRSLYCRKCRWQSKSAPGTVLCWRSPRSHTCDIYHPSPPRICKFWFVHKQISRVLREVGDFWPRDAVRRLGNWGCSKKRMRHKLINGRTDQHGQSLRPNGWWTPVLFLILIVIKDLIDHIFGSKKLSRSDDRVSPIGNKNEKNWLVPMLI